MPVIGADFMLQLYKSSLKIHERASRECTNPDSCYTSADMAITLLADCMADR